MTTICAKKKSLATLLLSVVLSINSISCAQRVTLKESLFPLESRETLPFQKCKKLSYEVRFNGIKVGSINFEYQGRKEIENIPYDIIRVASNINILKLFQIQSEELVYVDISDYLAWKVEREVRFLARKESILEEYNQKDGSIKITLKKDQTLKERLIYQEPPIHNSLILFFLYPLNFEEKLGKTMEFNLPLQEIKVKVKELRKIQTLEGIDEVYLLEVSNQRRTLIWIKKGERLPISLEVPAFLGRGVITKR